MRRSFRCRLPSAKNCFTRSRARRSDGLRSVQAWLRGVRQTIEGDSHGRHFRIDIVDEIERDGFASLRQGRRAELVRAVMAQNQDARPEWPGAAGNPGIALIFSRTIPAPIMMWPSRRPFGGIFDAARVAEFFDLADIVQDDAREQQIRIELGIVRRRRARDRSGSRHARAGRR